MYKISEQQVNPKVLSVVNSCHYNEMANIVYRQMPAPSGAAPTNPPRAKAWMQKPQGGGENPRGMVMDGIDTCINKM